jgi:hypothetical protein
MCTPQELGHNRYRAIITGERSKDRDVIVIAPDKLLRWANDGFGP